MSNNWGNISGAHHGECSDFLKVGHFAAVRLKPNVTMIYAIRKRLLPLVSAADSPHPPRTCDGWCWVDFNY